MSDDLDLEIEIARARAVAKEKQRKAEGRALPRLDPLPKVPPQYVPEAPDTSLQAKLKAGLMGASFNTAPRVEAFLSAASERPFDAVEDLAFSGGRSVNSEFQQDYESELRKKQPEYLKAVRDNPWSGVLGSFKNPAGKGGIVARTAQSAGWNALAGYMGANPDDPEAQSVDAQMGGLTGAAAVPIAEGVLGAGGRLVAKAAPVLRDFGRKRAIATLSPSKTDVGVMQNFPGRVQEIADDLYDSKMIGPLSNTEDVAKRLAPEVERRGARKGAVLAAVDSPDAVNPTDLADRIRYDATQELQPYAAKEAAFERALDEADKIAGKYDQLSLADSERFVKSGYDDAAQKAIRTEARGGVLPGETEALDVVRRAVKKQNEDIFAKRAAGTPLEGEFVKSKQAYGRLAEALNIADKTGGPKAANRFLSPTDYAMGISAGHAREVENAMSKPVESTLTGLAAALAHNQLRTRGAALMTHAGYKGSAAAKWLGELAGSDEASNAGTAAFRRYLLEHSPKAASDEAGQHFLNGG